MLFKPVDTKLWDMFILPHDGTYYLFYLQLRQHPWDGYGLATSSDLVHWTDHGTILSTDTGTGGMGTGMVWRVGDRWMLNYSLGQHGSQRIYFAESDDLFHWRKLPRDIVCAPDPRWYECTGDTTSGSARWDTIWVIPQPDGTFVGVVTATAKGAPAGANGVAGLVSSRDGIHWQTEPPASQPCGMGWAEVVGHVQFGPRHYLFVGSSSGLGARFDPVHSATGKSGGMYVMMADDVRGPYRLVDGDPLLLGCRDAPPVWAYLPTYCARACHVGDQTLLYHQWMPRDHFLDAWLGTLKVLEESAPGRLALRYWSGNDVLRGPCVFDLADAPAPLTPTPQAIPAGTWESAGGSLRGRTGASALAYFACDVPYHAGVVIEADLALSGDGAAGLFFGVDAQDADNPYEGVACLVNARGLYEFGCVRRSVCGPTFTPENHVVRPSAAGEVHRWRVLVRGEFVELYVNDDLIQCFGFSRVPTRNVGVFVERGEVHLGTLRLHRFA